MTWTTGTSDNYLDFMNDLRTAAVAAGWTEERWDTTSDYELILSSPDDVYVGIRSFSDGTTTGGVTSGGSYWNLEIAGMTGYISGNSFANQPGISPGRYEDSAGGPYVPLRNSSLTYKLSIRSRRIQAVIEMGSTDASFHAGLLNPFSAPSENSYPYYVGGSTSLETNDWQVSSSDFSGFADPSESTGSSIEAGQYRSADGTWYDVVNSNSSGSVATNDSVGVFPYSAYATPSTGEFDQVGGSGPNWAGTSGGIIVPAPSGNSREFILKDTPDSTATTGFQKILVPCILMIHDENESLVGPIGEIDGVFWCNNGVDSGDVISQGSEDYHVHRLGNRTEDWARFAIKEQ